MKNSLENVNEFAGFSEASIAFLDQLARNNRKNWFDERKAMYKTDVEKPAKALLAEIERKLSETLEQRYTGKLFRIYRDLRFSKDKTPFNPYLRFLFSNALDSQVGYFLSIESDGVIVGAGCMEFSKPNLAAYRERVSEVKEAKKLQKILDGISSKSPLRVEDPHLKKTPRGFESAPENDALLRRKGLAGWFDLSHDNSLFNKRAPSYFISQFKKLSPLNKWISELSV